ncbi:MAG: hypothetical protein WKF75_08890 [Singulisphaera sp.]
MPAVRGVSLLPPLDKDGDGHLQRRRYPPPLPCCSCSIRTPTDASPEELLKVEAKAKAAGDSP